MNYYIHKYLLKATTRFAKVFKLDENIDEEKASLIQNYTKENLDQLIKIVNMQDQILQSIQETTEILIHAFDISK